MSEDGGLPQVQVLHRSRVLNRVRYWRVILVYLIQQYRRRQSLIAQFIGVLVF